MIEPPSQQLIQVLSEFGLCKPRDLRRCRSLVRRLAHDLPAFDSVWIDALVHTRKLTHFQARELESGRRNRLNVGPCLLLNRLGHSDEAETFLARRRSGREKCVLKLIDVSIEERSSKLAALKEVTERLRELSHPSLVAPHTCLEHDGRLVAISRHVPGLHLGELLVRRGRFAAVNVLAIARQLVDALATLETLGSAHGDITLSNVRLTSVGRAVLIDTGVSTAVRPELSIHTRRTPERYEGIAPELIGTGNHPSPTSDMYALGCLLWQLLAGRPPFPTGDPLAKLAAHQTKTICDVREWAPDTPVALAEFIASLTAHNRLDRPESVEELRKRIGPPGRRDRRRLSRFRAAFETAAPRYSGAEPTGIRRRWRMLLLLLVCAGIGLAMLDPKTRTDPLSLPGRMSGYVRQQTADWFDETALPQDSAGGRDEPAAISSHHGNHIPAPDTAGVVLLDSNGPYKWQDFKSDGPIVIRGKAGLRPTIVVDDRPCRLVANRVTLENVHFVRRVKQENPQTSPTALLLVQSQQLSIVRCSFETSNLRPKAQPDESTAVRSYAIAWKRLAGGDDDDGGRIAVRDTLFVGQSTAMFLADMPAGIESVNCAKIGQGAMFALSGDVPAGKILSVQLTQLTLRRADSLLEWRATSDDGPHGFIDIQVSDCVFDLVSNNAALVQFVGDTTIDASTTRIEVAGAESLARPGLEIGLRRTLDGKYAELRDARVVKLEGITTGPFTFAGPVSGLPRDAAIDSFEMPRRSPQPPGIDASRLSVSSRPGSRLAN